MKILKLNSSYLFALTFCAFAVFMTSCSQDEETTTPSVDTESLKKSLEADPDFYLLQSLDNNLLNEVNKALTKAGLDGSDMKKAFESEESATVVVEALNDSQAEAITAQIEAVSSRLDAKYSSLQDDAFTEAEVESRRNEGFDTIGTDGEIINRWCSWKYYACRTAAYAGYFACLRWLPSWICRIGNSYAAYWCKRNYC